MSQIPGQPSDTVDASAIPGVPASGRASQPASEPEIVDVWSRTTPRYRRRAAAFLAINLLLFAALACFTYWLRTGDAHPVLRPAISLIGDAASARYGYWTFWKAAVRPFGPNQVTLTDFLMFPISVDQVPAHILIVGMLMGSLVTIPILVAMLYRLPAAIFFLLIVCFVGVLPWLSVTLLLSCLIARARPFQFSFRYATVLLALIPAVVYFIVASRGVSAEVAAMAGPIDRMKLYAPWMVTVIASCLGAGIVLAVAYLINYRPGGITPLLAVLFAVPVIVFQTEVGADELAYRLLEHDYGPNSGRVFVDMDPRELVERGAELEWVADDEKDERNIKAIVQNKMVVLKLALPTELLRQQHEVVERCDWFMRVYPESRYYWNCLYLKARALDMRIDMELLRREALLHFYADFPSEVSRETWQEILREKPTSPFASVAGLKLAMLAAREGRLKLSEDVLERVVTTFGGYAPNTPTTVRASGLRQLLARKPADSTLNVDPQAVAERAAQVLLLIRENKSGQFKDSLYPENNPISLLFRCDPHHASYRENLRHIDQWFPGSKFHDNLMVYLALTEHDVKIRRDRLQEVANRYRDGDAAPHALYELGVLELNHNRKSEGVQALELLLKKYPDSPWSASARRKLLSIDAAPSAK